MPEPDYWSIDKANDPTFVPVVNDSPRTLTESQISEFNERGFINGLRLLNEREASEHRERFNRLLAKFQRKQRDSYDINGYQTRVDFIWDLATHPRLLDHIEDLIGPNIVLWASHYFCKLPQDQRVVPFHQDASYWPLRPFKAVTAWLAVDPVTLDMGPMCFLPGSHLEGRLAWQRRSDNVVLELETRNYAQLGEPSPILLDAGEFSIHTDLLVHGSGLNQTQRRRCGLTLRYIPAEVRLSDDRYRKNWTKHAIICRGADESGFWQHNPRPTSLAID